MLEKAWYEEAGAGIQSREEGSFIWVVSETETVISLAKIDNLEYLILNQMLNLLKIPAH